MTTLQRRLAVLQQGHNGFAVARRRSVLTDDVVTVADVLVDHAIAGDVEDERLPGAVEDLLEVERLGVLDGFDGAALVQIEDDYVTGNR